MKEKKRRGKERFDGSFSNVLKCQVQRAHDTGSHTNAQPENNVTDDGSVFHVLGVGQGHQWYLEHLKEEQVESQSLEDNVHGQLVDDGA